MAEPRIEPGECPGGVVCVAYDGAGSVVERVGLLPGEDQSIDAAALRHADDERVVGIVFFDGDTGAPMLSIRR